MKTKEINPEQQSDTKKKYHPPKEIRPEHQEFMIKLGIKLQNIRNEKHISISHLSSELGISRNSYSQMEKGRVYYNFLNLLQVLDYHKIPASEFFKEL
jgi:DNA-binding XRE family transcriptional regulator